MGVEIPARESAESIANGSDDLPSFSAGPNAPKAPGPLRSSPYAASSSALFMTPRSCTGAYHRAGACE
jgi:hypothetical protein